MWRMHALCELQRIRQIGARHAREWQWVVILFFFRHQIGVCVTIDDVRALRAHAGNRQTWSDNRKHMNVGSVNQLAIICNQQTLFLISLREISFERIEAQSLRIVMVCREVPRCHSITERATDRKHFIL